MPTTSVAEASINRDLTRLKLLIKASPLAITASQDDPLTLVAAAIQVRHNSADSIEFYGYDHGKAHVHALLLSHSGDVVVDGLKGRIEGNLYAATLNGELDVLTHIQSVPVSAVL
jgi:hypothetical protein